MDYLGNNDDLFGLKIEDNSAHYLFSSLIGGQNHHDGDCMQQLLKEEEDPALHIETPQPQPYFSEPHPNLINELQQYLCLRTTPLNDIINYVETYYPLTKAQLRTLLT